MTANINELVFKFMSINAPKFLDYYYYNYITNCKNTENYFRKYGGDDWLNKFHSSKDYKYYIECINGSIFKDELKILIDKSTEDLIEIINHDEINGYYKIEDYSDIFYNYEQFEIIFRNYCNH